MGRIGPIAPMLVAVARRALYEDWEPNRRVELAETLRDHQQFGYARRLLGRVRAAGADSEELRQQYALCTYKDMELPAARRLDRALQILNEGGPLDDSTNAETLGLAGAIFKHKWTLDAKRFDLESAYWCYGRGLEQEGDPRRDYAGVNAAFVADQLAELEDQGPGVSTEAAELRARADAIRAEIVARLAPDDGGWAEATLGEAHFGLGHFEQATEHLARVAAETRELWRLETTAMQLGALARLRGYDSAAAAGALKALVGGQDGRRPARLHRQGRPGALRGRLSRLAVSHRHPRPARRVQGPAPGRGALMRLRRLDPRRLLLPEAARAAAVEAGRRDRGRRLHHPRARARRRVPRRCPRQPPRPADRGHHRQLEDALLEVLADRPRRGTVRAHVLLQGGEGRARRARHAVANDRSLHHHLAAARTGSRCATRTGCARQRSRSWSSTRRP